MTAPYAARDDDTEGLAQIAELLEKVADEKAPLPDIEATRRRLSHGLDLTSRLTVGEWLDMWSRCSTPPTSHGGSSTCTRRSTSRQSGSTTSATAPRPSPTRPVPT
ncbi:MULTISPECIES: hypothetical protein [unclassified Streptomyces]|uniref:hypothetical protein n=1 Tax=unclassified Streptomyces TaxID=2593676 RepID=UPI00336A018C